jgi:myo-inositol-1(or 4)-monophosphatase
MVVQPRADPYKLAAGLCAIVEGAIERFGGSLLETALGNQGASLRADVKPGDFVSTFDLELHDYYCQQLSNLLPDFILASEEAEVRALHRGRALSSPGLITDLIALVDPLDSSELAVRGLHAHTHVLLYSRSAKAPIAAVVGDFFHPISLYYAYSVPGRSPLAFARTRDGVDRALQASGARDLAGTLVTNYLMRPRERFPYLARQHRLLSGIAGNAGGRVRGLIGVDFGSIGLCHVAAGMTDAMVETAVGFSPWDLLPGQYILEAAGGVVLDLAGKRLQPVLPGGSLPELQAAMAAKQRFVAAGDALLAEQIVEVLQDGRYTESRRPRL